jgi:hypothetical protein
MTPGVGKFEAAAVGAARGDQPRRGGHRRQAEAHLAGVEPLCLGQVRTSFLLELALKSFVKYTLSIYETILNNNVT